MKKRCGNSFGRERRFGRQYAGREEASGVWRRDVDGGESRDGRGDVKSVASEGGLYRRHLGEEEPQVRFTTLRDLDATEYRDSPTHLEYRLVYCEAPTLLLDQQSPFIENIVLDKALIQLVCNPFLSEASADPYLVPNVVSSPRRHSGIICKKRKMG